MMNLAREQCIYRILKTAYNPERIYLKNFKTPLWEGAYNPQNLEKPHITLTRLYASMHIKVYEHPY